MKLITLIMKRILPTNLPTPVGRWNIEHLSTMEMTNRKDVETALRLYGEVEYFFRTRIYYSYLDRTQTKRH